MTSEQIFESECKKLILASMEGINVTIFTYGQTASGKTFTMRGDPDQGGQPGLIPLSLKEIFHELYTNHGQSTKNLHGHGQHLYYRDPSSGNRKSYSPKDKKIRTWVIKVSYIEIYNECVNDLLDVTRKNLSVRENQQGRTIIENLSEYEVSSLEETMAYLQKGDEQRKIAETRLNEKSSRSHTVFKISI
jgi:centromeric protein E